MANLTNKFLDLAFEQAKINLGSTKQNTSVGCSHLYTNDAADE